MVQSLKALLREIVDYAGLFPPAGLAMEPAAGNYARYRVDARSWMLGRFICPAARLEELGPTIGPRTPEDPDPWRLSVLGAPAEDAGSFLPGLRNDLAHVAAFTHRSPGYAIPEVFEVRLPPSVVSEARPETVRRVLEGAAETLSAAPVPPRAVYYEVGFPAAWERALDVVAGEIGALNRGGAPVSAGLKIRTGGVVASAFPPPEQVARFLVAAREAGVPMKATAGLHHPLRRFSPDVDAFMHGFLNVFAGAVLARTEDLDAGALEAILADEDPVSFRFDEEGLGWRNRGASLAQIAAARREFAVSFGSCSFTEPVEDLEDLGLL